MIPDDPVIERLKRGLSPQADDQKLYRVLIVERSGENKEEYEYFVEERSLENACSSARVIFSEWYPNDDTADFAADEMSASFMCGTITAEIKSITEVISERRAYQGSTILDRS